MNYLVHGCLILLKLVRHAVTHNKESLGLLNHNHILAFEGVAFHCTAQHDFVGWGAIVQGYLTLGNQLIVTPDYLILNCRILYHKLYCQLCTFTTFMAQPGNGHFK